jgi:hypothetical protein
VRRDIKDRWVARLRSGQDEQGQSYLNRNGKKCCLGVLCEIAIEDSVVTRIDDGDGFMSYLYTDDHGSQFLASTLLPPPVKKWAGLGSDNGAYNDEPDGLVHHNDGLGQSFAEIAEIIESNWETM